MDPDHPEGLQSKGPVVEMIAIVFSICSRIDAHDETSSFLTILLSCLYINVFEFSLMVWCTC